MKCRTDPCWEMVKEEFFEHGYKFHWICPDTNCICYWLVSKISIWFDSRGCETKPHSSWLKKITDHENELARVASEINSHYPRRDRGGDLS
jgi:hypothetical protein